MLGLPECKTRFSRRNDDTLGAILVHYLAGRERRFVTTHSQRIAPRQLRLCLWILTCLPIWAFGEAAVAQSSAASPAALTVAQDLAADANILRQSRIPMVILYSQADCAWCERARREFLVPMANEPGAAQRVMLRQVDLDRDTPLKDFAGRATTHRAFARAHKARFTPTLMFYGPDGGQLAEPIIGFRLADFYGTYIERSIDEGLILLRGKKS